MVSIKDLYGLFKIETGPSQAFIFEIHYEPDYKF